MLAAGLCTHMSEESNTFPILAMHGVVDSLNMSLDGRSDRDLKQMKLLL